MALDVFHHHGAGRVRQGLHPREVLAGDETLFPESAGTVHDILPAQRLQLQERALDPDLRAADPVLPEHTAAEAGRGAPQGHARGAGALPAVLRFQAAGDRHGSDGDQRLLGHLRGVRASENRTRGDRDPLHDV